MGDKSFGELRSAEEFLSYYQNPDRALRHTAYFHYTKLKNIDEIMRSGQLRLTSLCKTANDTIEKKWYEEKGKHLFSLCFSTGTSENLPLWYLYSGTDGRGARLGLTKSNFKKVFAEPQFSLAEVEASPPYDIITTTPLSKDDYILEIHDILYIGKDTSHKNTYRIKHNTDVINGITHEVYEELKNQYSHFTKGLIWFYEKETRVQVKITNHSLLKPDKNYCVVLDIEPYMPLFSIRLAPEFNREESIEIENCPGIQKYLFKKIEHSDYAGEIEMRLK